MNTKNTEIDPFYVRMRQVAQWDDRLATDFPQIDYALRQRKIYAEMYINWNWSQRRIFKKSPYLCLRRFFLKHRGYLKNNFAIDMEYIVRKNK